MNSFLTNSRRSQTAAARSLKSSRPCMVEGLETRQLFNAMLAYDGMLSVSGTYMNDVTSVNFTSGGTMIRVDMQSGTMANRTWYFDAKRVKNVSFGGGDGNDVFANNTQFWSYQWGGNGNDLLYGGSGQDVMYGELGNDNLYGGNGNDFLYGSGGTDYLVGGNGNDTSWGDWDNDIIESGAGNDWVSGGYGNDYIYGDDGNDILSGDDGNDRLFGGNGMDSLYGGRGDDYLSGGQDDVTDGLWGGTGRDVYVTDWVYSYARGGWYNTESAGDINAAWEYDYWANA